MPFLSLMAILIRQFAWLVCLATMLGRPAGAAEPASTVTALQIAEQGGLTKVVIELSHRADYRVYLLDEPMRLVLDLPPVSWKLGARAPAARGVVAGFRFGHFDAETSRLVLDLSDPARVRKSGYELASSRSAQRLVLDLEPVPREAFAAEVQPWAASGGMLRGPAIAAASASAAAQLLDAPSAPAGALAAQPPPSAAAVPAAGSVPAARRSPPHAKPPRRGEKKPVIAIDPGHGGVDPGAVGVRGTFEKDITLAVAREIRRQLEATGRYRVVLTRDADVFLRLRDRVAKARAAEADLFVSIHADSIGTARMRGASIYTLSETASDAEAASLAARENRADIIAGVDLSAENKEVASILIDLAQRETMNHSAAFAAVLVRELGREVQLIATNPHRFAGFAVLKAPDIPSVLIELGYLSNREEEALLNRPHYRSKVAGALVRAIDAFLATRTRS